MQRYSIEVKLFALEKRRDSSGWGEVRRAIEEKFGIEPPTIRALQRWQKELATKEGLSRALTEQATKKSEIARAQALTQVADGLLPRLFMAKEAGEDIEYSGWRWFFSIQENVLGSDKFKRFIRQYLTDRDNKPELLTIPPTQSEKRSQK